MGAPLALLITFRRVKKTSLGVHHKSEASSISTSVAFGRADAALSLPSSSFSMQITSIPQTGAGGGASPPGAAGGAIGALELPALSGGGGGMSGGGVGEGCAPGAMQPDAKKIKAATAKMAANFAIPMQAPQSDLAFVAVEGCTVCAGTGGGISPTLPSVQSDATFTQ